MKSLRKSPGWPFPQSILTFKKNKKCMLSFLGNSETFPPDLKNLLYQQSYTEDDFAAYSCQLSSF